MASSTTSPKVSVFEGKTKTSEIESKSTNSWPVLQPVKTVSVLNFFLSDFRDDPSPITSFVPGSLHFKNASMFFSAVTRPRKVKIGFCSPSGIFALGFFFKKIYVNAEWD